MSACLAFLFDPDVLILDEPTAGLDPIAAEILKEKVRAEREKNKLVLLSALMGYTGAMIKDLLGTAGGVSCASVMLWLWAALPLFLSWWIFRRKDL